MTAPLARLIDTNVVSEKTRLRRCYDARTGRLPAGRQHRRSAR